MCVSGQCDFWHPRCMHCMGSREPGNSLRNKSKNDTGGQNSDLTNYLTHSGIMQWRTLDSLLQGKADLNMSIVRKWHERTFETFPRI